jgi:hypothetical protein
MKIKQSEVIQKLAKLFDSIPEEASSYHVCDMLMYKAEKMGLLIKEEHDEEYYYILQTVIKTDEKNI